MTSWLRGGNGKACLTCAVALDGDPGGTMEDLEVVVLWCGEDMERVPKL